MQEDMTRMGLFISGSKSCVHTGTILTPLLLFGGAMAANKIPFIGPTSASVARSIKADRLMENFKSANERAAEAHLEDGNRFSAKVHGVFANGAEIVARQMRKPP